MPIHKSKSFVAIGDRVLKSNNNVVLFINEQGKISQNNNLSWNNTNSNLGIGTAPLSNYRVNIKGVNDLNNNFALFVGGANTTGLVVRNDGRVGIGTLTLNEALNVSGNVSVNGNIVATGNISGTITGNIPATQISSGVFGSVAGKGNYTFQATNNTNPVLFIDGTNERVGLLMSSPSFPFHARFSRSGHGNIIAGFENTNGSVSDPGSVVLRFISGSFAGQFEAYHGGSIPGSGIIQFGSHVANSSAIFFAGSNAVEVAGPGSGNSSFSRLILHYSSTNTTENVLALYRRTTGVPAIGIGARLAFHISDGQSVNWPSVAAAIGAMLSNVTSGSQASVLTFSTRTGGGGIVERMRIDDVGNVGIGLQNPSSRLEIETSEGQAHSSLRIRRKFTPSGNSDPSGAQGNFAWDNDYFYIKTDIGWKRVALSSF